MRGLRSPARSPGSPLHVRSSHGSFRWLPRHLQLLHLWVLCRPMLTLRSPRAGGGAGPAGDRVVGLGFRQSELPVHEASGGPWSGHVDGVWSGGSAPLQVHLLGTRCW